MIHSSEFYRRFAAGFASSAPRDAVSRAQGAPGRYILHTGAGDVRVWFRVNQKASAIPYNPGQFWPVMIAPDHCRHATAEDDGTVSWYQYVSPLHVAAIQAHRRSVVERVAATVVPDEWQAVAVTGPSALELLLEQEPEPRLPSTPLFYLDGADAEAWGRLLGAQVPHWMEAFASAPESLTQYMWRVHWTETSSH